MIEQTPALHKVMGQPGVNRGRPLDTPFRFRHAPDTKELDTLIDLALANDADAMQLVQSTLNEPESANALFIIYRLITRNLLSQAKHLMSLAAKQIAMHLKFEPRQPEVSVSSKPLRANNLSAQQAPLLEGTAGVPEIAEAAPEEAMKLEPPPKLHPLLAVTATALKMSESTDQKSFESLPPRIQDALRRIFADTVYLADAKGRNEYANIAIELADGKIITDLENTATSYQEGAVISGRGFTYLLSGLDKACEKHGGKNQQIRIYMMHCHPQRRENLESTRYHLDGRAYTYLSPQDYFSAGRQISVMAKILREKGYSGPIELVMQALPVPLRPMEELSGNIYVVQHTAQVA
jgi:hypothetical protein